MATDNSDITETRWWWVRHAPSDAPKNRLIGRSDPAAYIDEALQPEIKALEQNLPTDAFWISSPLRRAIETCDAIRDGTRDLICAEFSEQNFGDWDGLSYDEISDRFPSEAETLWRNLASARPPNGESFEDVCARVSEAVKVLNTRKPSEDIVVIAHAGTIRAALAFALNISAESALKFQIDPLSLTTIDAIHLPQEETSWRINAVNIPT